MKTKTKMIFSAALAAALIALPRAHAATSGAAATNAPAAAAATATNSKPGRRDGGAVRRPGDCQRQGF